MPEALTGLGRLKLAMNAIGIAIVAIILGRLLLAVVSDLLNIRAARAKVPAELAELYDPADYEKSQNYLRDNTRLSIASDLTTTSIILALMLSGAFGALDAFVRHAHSANWVRGILFLGTFGLVMQLVSLPFAIYSTFGIETRYGFNTTSPKTFILDILKGWLLALVIGAPLFALLILFFEHLGAAAWPIAWAGLIAVQGFLVFISPIVIFPLFNKFLPLDEGDLRSTLEHYLERHRFRVRGLYRMDGSRRSTKANAFAAGYGRLRRIVLFDTLIAKHTSHEILAIVAHELGHARHRHVARSLIRAIPAMGLFLALLSLALQTEGLFEAFGVNQPSAYAGIIFFSFLYTPLSVLHGIVENRISRDQEYEADAFAATSTGLPEALISGLKKLSVDTLSNLTPHPLTVVLDYSHPPLLQRIRALQRLADTTSHAATTS